MSSSAHGAQDRRSSRSVVLRPAIFALLYSFVGVLWILFSDWALERFVPADTARLTAAQTAKGIFFILLGAGAIYLVAVTSARRTRSVLAKSEFRLQHVLDSVSDYAIFMLDAKGRVATWNTGAAQMSGLAAADVLGQPYDRFWTEEDRRAGAPQRALAEAAAAGRYAAETWSLRADGSRYWAHLTMAAMRGEGGRLDGFAVVKRDRTLQRQAEAALRESEKRFQSLADSVPEMLYMTDEAGGCVFVNKPWLDYVGRPLEALLGYGWADDMHPEDRGVLRQEDQAFVERRGYEHDYRLRRADGVYRWFLDRGVPRFGEDGRFLGYVGGLIDVEDRRRLEQELRQAVKMEAVGLLTGGIAHDFNNLLTVILGNLELAGDGAETPRLRRILSTATLAAERSAALTQQLLAFSRQQTLQPQPLDLNRQIGQMIELLRRTLGENIEIVCRLAPDLWPALADRAQVESAVVNLAVNARDAMPRGGRLSITTEILSLRDADRGLPAGDYVVMAVSDSGLGMTPEVLERAVQPFFTTKEVGKGSGLGLSTIYGFAEQSGGKLEIESAVGVGTTVRLILPRARQVADAASEGESARDLPRGSETILVVEDDAAVRSLAVAQLGELGYRTLQAPDGFAALDLLARTPGVDLLLTDLMMPRGMSGLELAEQAGSRWPRLKLLLTSGYSEEAIGPMDRIARYPFLAKPYRRRDLAYKVRQALDAAG